GVAYQPFSGHLVEEKQRLRAHLRTTSLQPEKLQRGESALSYKADSHETITGGPPSGFGALTRFACTHACVLWLPRAPERRSRAFTRRTDFGGLLWLPSSRPALTRRRFSYRPSSSP